MRYYSYTLQCATTGRIIVDDLEATTGDVRVYRRQYASSIKYGRMVEIVVERHDSDEEEY